MNLTKLLDEFLIEMKLRNRTERTIKSVRNNSKLFFKSVVVHIPADTPLLR